MQHCARGTTHREQVYMTFMQTNNTTLCVMKIQLCAHDAQPCEQSCANLRVPIPFHLRERSMQPKPLESCELHKHFIESVTDFFLKLTEL